MEDRYLYKAKRTDNGEWVEGYLVETRHNTYHDGYRIIDKDGINYDELDYYEPSFISYVIDKTTICQCTGLKDKNGKLIWENDVVDFLGHKGIVKYECGSFGVAYRECIDWEEIESNICHVTGCDNALYACENDNFISLWEIYWNFNDEDNSVNTVEVIGNIFDNPELMHE